MIPLLFIVLGLGAAGFAAYEFSPKTRTWTDDHVKAIRDAIAAHHEADAKLVEAQAAVQAHVATQAPDTWGASGPPAPGKFDPAAIWAQGGELLQHAYDKLMEASHANRVAAASTIPALKTAKTDQQTVTATQSAVAVDARQKQIAAALEALGVGQCGVRTYHVTSQLKDVLLAKLHAKGMAVTQTGISQWDVDANEGGVKLRAVWNPQSQELHLIVTDSWLIATCPKIWAKIDPVLKEILGA